MKVKFDKSNLVKLENITTGDCFEFENCLHVLVSSYCHGGNYRCYNLSKIRESFESLPSEYLVRPVDVTVVENYKNDPKCILELPTEFEEISEWGIFKDNNDDYYIKCCDPEIIGIRMKDGKLRSFGDSEHVMRVVLPGQTPFQY